MPEFLRGIFRAKDIAHANEYVGLTGNGAITLRDRRGTVMTEIPDIELKSGGSDPLAIYKPTGIKTVDAAKAMANFTGWTYAAVNAIASEVANIQLRLFTIIDDDHEEMDVQTPRCAPE